MLRESPPFWPKPFICLVVLCWGGTAEAQRPCTFQGWCAICSLLGILLIFKPLIQSCVHGLSKIFLAWLLLLQYLIIGTIAQNCGANIGSCVQPNCCSQWGWCGVGSDYCGTKCQPQYGACNAPVVLSPPPPSPRPPPPRPRPPPSILTKMTRLVVYIASFAQYRSSIFGRPDWCDAYATPPDSVNYTVPTHVIYAFVHVEPGTFKVIDADPYDRIYQQETQNLKNHNPNLKTLVSIGGWSFSRGEGDLAGSEAIFPALSSTPANRAKFVRNAIAYARERGFDGVDIDWEYPNYDGKRPLEVAAFTSLVNDMIIAFYNESRVTGRPRLLLSTALPSDPGNHFNLAAIHPRVDFINLMSYDFTGAWALTNGQGRLGFNAPVVNCAGGADIRSGLTKYVAARVNFRKINLGLALYGRGFATAVNGSILPGAAAARGLSAPGDCTNEAGVLAWYEIKRKIGTSPVRIDSKALSAYASFDGGKQWVGFDNAQTHKLKMCWARYNNIGGVMAWDASLDEVGQELLQAMRINMDSTCFGFRMPTC